MGLLRSPDGTIVNIPDDQVGSAKASGYTEVSLGEAAQTTAAREVEDTGITGGVNAFATGALSGLTLGGSDYALKNLLDQGQFERLVAGREQHPISSIGGQIVGAVLPAFAAPGSLLTKTPAGLLSGAAQGVAAGGGFGASLVGAGIEGAGQNVGAYIADTALGDRELSAEGLSGALGVGFAFGVGGGVVAHGIERGMIAARRMFARVAEGGEQAASDAAAAWDRTSQETIQANDQVADAARARLAEARTARMQADLAKKQARATELEQRAAGPAAESSKLQSDVNADFAAKFKSSQAAQAEERAAAEAAPAIDPKRQARGEELAFMSDMEPTPENVARLLAHDDALTAARSAGMSDDKAWEAAQAAFEGRSVPAVSAAEEQKLTAALAEHDAARANLDDLFRRLQAPEIEPGVGSQVTVPRGQFEDLAEQGPLARGTPVRVTTVGKKLGEGTPVLNEQPSGLEGLVRAQREAGPTGLEDLVRMQREAAPPRTVEAVRAEYDGVMARLKASRDVPERLRLSKQADTLSDELDALGDFTPVVSKAPPKPAEPDRFAPGKDGVIPVLEHPTDEAASFILRRVRDQGVHWGTDHPLDPGKHFLGTLGIDWKVPAHKKTLMALLREGKVILSRADLVGAMDPALVKASEIHHIGSDFHFINADKRTLAALAKSEPVATEAMHAAPSGRVGAASAPASDLEAALQGTAAKLNTGSEIGSVSRESPARAEYVAQKAAKTEADAAHFRAAANERNYAGSAMSAAEREAQDAASAEFDKFFADLRRPKTRDAYVAQNIGRAMREEGSHAAALAKVEREWAGQTGHPIAAKQLEQAHDSAMERAATATDPAERVAAIQEARAAEEQLTRFGKRPGAVEDVAAAAPIISRYEKATAELTEALGDAAPPPARAAAKAYREAETTAERKTMDRTTRAIDAQAAEQDRADRIMMLGKYAPRKLTDKELLGIAKADKLSADAAHARAVANEAEARLGAVVEPPAPRAAPQSSVPVAGRSRPGRGGRIVDAAAVAELGVEIADSAGLTGLPHPRDIPIVGGFLNAYLKYRLLKAAAGRFVGRVPASGDARAAALVARVKDRVVVAVDRSLGLAERAARAGRPAIVAASVKAMETLRKRAVDDGEPDAPKDASLTKLAAVRIREVANAATRPDLVLAQVRKELKDVADPDLIAAVEKHRLALFQALNEVAPKAPPQNPYTQVQWEPSRGAALKFVRQYEAAFDPASVFEALHQQSLTPEAAEMLRKTSPKLFGMAQQRLVSRAGDLEHPVEYKQLLRSGLLFDVPLHPSMEPENAAVLQSVHIPPPPAQPAGPPAAPTPSIANGTNLTALYQPEFERRTAMR